ncbi:MAG TPA: glycosyl hydrolase, partial [Prolixibacteraceae bacterium]
MKRALILLSILAVAFIFASGLTDKAKVSDKALGKGFITPPDSIQTSVYWYWISDNISKEGVVKDLQSMKKAGINRAFIGNIGLDDIPYGKVKMLSEAWWDILHVALKTATELNIEIGIFNSPGWSQSGGPWVKADAAMRYLTASKLRVKGPLKFRQKLEKPIDIFQDVKVIAYPVPKDDRLVLNTKNGRVTSSPHVTDLDKIVDGDNKTGISFPASGEFVVDIQANAPFTARSLSVRSTEQPMNVTAAIQ